MVINTEQFFGAREETINRLKNLYDESYFGDVRLNKLREKMYLQEIGRLIKHFDFFKKGERVLDIGCGGGGFLSLFGPNWEKYGMEISDYARKLANDRGVITDFEIKDNFFDLIIFRGTIQHIPDPIHRIEQCFYWLRRGGGIVFLATPNTNSLVFKLFNDLPMINSQRNFLLPSDKMLKQILQNFGFTNIEFEYPYLSSPYANLPKDILSFILRLFGIKRKTDFPFYKNIMECYARKY